MEFFNMGIIIVLTSFDPTNIMNLIRGTEDKKMYMGFEARWYGNVGQDLCTTIFLSALATNIPEVTGYLKVELKRLFDRGFKPNLKKDLEDEDDDEPNSKLKLQEDLN